MKGEETMATFGTISVAREIVQLINSPSTRIAQVSAVLTKDPTLMKSILRRANAPVYGFRERISDVNLAIILLGFDVLKKTVASTIIHDTLRRVVSVFATYETFWEHSIHVAVLASTLANELQREDADDAFTAGLLHDIGHIVRAFNIPLSLPSKNQHSGESHSLDHAVAGALLAEQWEIPSHIVTAIRYHEVPHNAPHDAALSALVHIADVMSNHLRKSHVPEEDASPCLSDACRILGIPLNTFDTFVESVLFKKLKNAFPQGAGVELMEMVRSTILDALSSLPEEERIVLALRYYDGLTFSEIGQLCGYDACTAEHLHGKALCRLKTLFIPDKTNGSTSL